MRQMAHLVSRTIRSSQSRGQLHRLLPERAQLRWGATLWRNRPARQQTHSHSFGRGSVAAVALATRLACPAEILEKLRVGASLKKKTAVALARQLDIDLWRWRTGRATATELGWTVASATGHMLGTK